MNALTNNLITSRVVYFVIAIVLTLISGTLLSFLGRPLNSLVFTIHKLSAVAAIILIGLSARNLIKIGDVHMLYLFVTALAGLLLLALVISGALLSFERPVPQLPLRIHQLLPVLALAASILSIYLFASNRS